MKFYILSLILFILFNSINTHNLQNRKLKEINATTAGSEITTKTNASEDNTYKEEKSSQIIQFFLKDLVVLYFQIFIVFTIASILRCYEESVIIKELYVKNRYSLCEDISNSEVNPHNYEDKNVFTSGFPVIKEAAKDDRLNQLLSCNTKYLKIQRLVEVFNPIAKKWENLGRNNNNNSKIMEDFNEFYMTNDVNMIGSDYIQLSYTSQIYTFPKLMCSTFIGKVRSNKLIF